MLVAGRFVKRDGELVGVDTRARQRLAESALRARALAPSRPAAGALLPPAPEGFADLINTVAAQHLARAWTIEVKS